MELSEQTYWLIHLRNGVTVYTAEEPALEKNEENLCSVRGLDDEPYYFPRDAVMLLHRSTPLSRGFYVRLTVDLQQEMQNEKREMLQELMERQKQEAESHGMTPKDGVSSAIDALRRSPRPVD